MQAMETLKKKITTTLTLIRINYAPNVSEIIVVFNINIQKWSTVLI